MSYTTATPAPWMQERVNSDLIMLRGPVVDGSRDTVAAVNGPRAEANAAVICDFSRLVADIASTTPDAAHRELSRIAAYFATLLFTASIAAQVLS